MTMLGTMDHLGRPYLRVNAPDGYAVLMLVDTSFNGTIMLSRHALRYLGNQNTQIDHTRRKQIILGDDSVSSALIGRLRIYWFHEVISIEMLFSEAVPSNPLGEDDILGIIGTEMLRDCQLSINFPRKTMSIKRK